MKGTRISLMATSKSHALGLLRHHADIDVAADGERTWVRMMHSSDALERALHNLPGAQHFTETGDGWLIPLGKRLPMGRLPELRWQSIASLVNPALPAAALAGRARGRCRLELRRSTSPQVPNVLITDLRSLVGYGCAAAEVRLNRWRFAVRRDGQALVWGDPVPSLPGQLYVERERVAAPAGWEIVPERRAGDALPSGSRLNGVDSRVLARVLDVGPGELVLFRRDASIERIGADDLVRASRAALRASLEACADD